MVDTSTLSIQVEWLDSVLDELLPILSVHYEELATHKNHMVLNPDWDRYRMMEKAGSFFVLTARVQGKVVGYHGIFITPALHYKDLTVASSDVLFLVPEYRDSPVGGKLMQASTKYSKRLGAKAFLWKAKKGTRLDQLMQKMQVPTQDITYYETLE